MPTSCKVARDPNKYNPLFNNRQTMRQKLTWAIRLALAELKARKVRGAKVLRVP